MMTLTMIRTFMDLSRSAIELKLMFHQAYEVIKGTQFYQESNQSSKHNKQVIDRNSVNYNSLNMTLNASFTDMNPLNLSSNRVSVAKGHGYLNSLFSTSRRSTLFRPTLRNFTVNTVDKNWTLDSRGYGFNDFVNFTEFKILNQVDSDLEISENRGQNKPKKANLSPILIIPSLAIAPKQKVAILSDSETPVSTIFDVMLRIPYLTEGSIEINGINIDHFGVKDTKKLRQQIFYMSKDIPIFSQDLKTNIHPDFKNKDLKRTEYLKIFEILKKFAQFGKKLDSFGLNLKLQTAQ